MSFFVSIKVNEIARGNLYNLYKHSFKIYLRITGQTNNSHSDDPVIGYK